MHDFVHELSQLLMQTTTASNPLVGNLSTDHVVAMHPEPLSDAI